MTRFTFAALLVPTLLSSTALAGPACSKKYSQSQQCAQLCKSNWGFKSSDGQAGAGMFMGMDPWGIVIEKTGKSIEEWIADACGVESSTTTTSAAPQGTVKGNLGSASPAASSSQSSATPAVPSSSSSSTSSSSSSSSETTTSTAKPSTTPKDTPTKQQEPTTTSTPPPPPPPTTTKSPDPAPQPTNTPDNGNQGGNQGNQGGGNTGGGGGGGGASSGDEQAWLDAHNSFRAQHGAGAMTWSDEAAGKAQQWANNCQFKHSGGSLGPFGENLASGTGDSYNVQAAFKSWSDESKDYDGGNPQPSHFTQVVWKGSNQVGCALAECDGIFDPSFGKAKFYVCEYSPQGNIIGSFAQNVQ